MIRSIINLFKQILNIPSIENYLVRKIDPVKIRDAFELEHQEFYKEPSDGSGLSSLFMEREWKPFINKLSLNDELWFYRLPAEFWQRMKGHQGYVIMRNGKKVAKVITKWN